MTADTLMEPTACCYQRVRQQAGSVFEELDLQVSVGAGVLVEWNGDEVEGE